METSQPSPRRKGHEIVRAYKRKQLIRALVIGVVVGLLCAAVVGLVIWRISSRRP